MANLPIDKRAAAASFAKFLNDITPSISFSLFKNFCRNNLVDNKPLPIVCATFIACSFKNDYPFTIRFSLLNPKPIAVRLLLISLAAFIAKSFARIAPL